MKIQKENKPLCSFKKYLKLFSFPNSECDSSYSRSCDSSNWKDCEASEARNFSYWSGVNSFLVSVSPVTMVPVSRLPMVLVSCVPVVAVEKRNKKIKSKRLLKDRELSVSSFIRCITTFWKWMHKSPLRIPILPRYFWMWKKVFKRGTSMSHTGLKNSH